MGSNFRTSFFGTENDDEDSAQDDENPDDKHHAFAGVHLLCISVLFCDEFAGVMSEY